MSGRFELDLARLYRFSSNCMELPSPGEGGSLQIAGLSDTPCQGEPALELPAHQEAFPIAAKLIVKKRFWRMDVGIPAPPNRSLAPLPRLSSPFRHISVAHG